MLLVMNMYQYFLYLGLLTKALEITWSRPNELSGVILCEGGMHLLMSIFSGIGYLYGDAGLKQLLCELNVYAAGSVERMLSGNDFDRALRGLKLVDEVLTSRFILQFKSWCTQRDKILPGLDEQLQSLEEMMPNTAESEILEYKLSELIAIINVQITPLLDEFRTEGRQMSATFRFWDDFLWNVMRPLKMFVHASRVGKWCVYQSSKASLLPLLFATARSNYAKYMPVMLLAMTQLPEQVEHAFQEGIFVAKLTEGNFNAVWLDYTLEVTENKALKGSGGIIGLRMRGDALARWFLARPIAAKYSMNFHNSCKSELEREQSHLVHHTAGKSYQNKWKGDVSKMSQMFDTGYIDPFELCDPPTQLVNFASGVMTTTEIEDSMISALAKGKYTAEKFVRERLATQTRSKSFYDPVPRCSTKTMTKLRKSVKVKSKDVLMDGEIMYLRLLAVNAHKKVSLERVMSFENSPTPLSIFDETGCMVSCTKSDFLHKLEDLLAGEKITEVQSGAVIYDGHAIIQMIPGPSTEKTFWGMAKIFTAHILSRDLSKNATQIHVVFDRYFENSVKSATRFKRSGGASRAPLHHIQPDGKIPNDWKAFLLRDENKAALAKCYTDYMIQQAGELLHRNQILILSGGQDDNVVGIKADSCLEIPELRSNHEEADTRMLLHAAYSANHGQQCITVSSPDTDVFVLLIHHYVSIHVNELYFYTERQGKHTDMKRFISVHGIHQNLSQYQRDILLAVYCLT